MTPSRPSTASLLLVEDDPDLGDRIARSLREAGHDVTLADRIAAIDPSATGPAVAVVDIRLPGASGLEAVRLLRETDPALPVVFISGQSEPQEIIDAMKLGAIEFLLKPFSLDQLLDAVDRALGVRRAGATRDERERQARQRVARLTQREREVCALLVQGIKTGQVASRLGITPGTAKIHRMHILDKLGAASFDEVARLLEQAGLIQTWDPGQAASASP